jgi:transcriptional regulator with XRE-family HTH domain
MDKNNIIGQRIKEHRKAQNMTQLELSQLLSVSHSFISKIESGKKRPPFSHIQDIASALQISPSLLVEDTYLLDTLKQLQEKFDLEEIQLNLQALIAEAQERTTKSDD